MSTMSNSPSVLFELRDNIGLIRLNRPNEANGLNADMARELKNIVLEAHENDAVDALILTAEGKFFSAGGDLKSFTEVDNTSLMLHQVTVDIHSALMYLHRNTVPVICAINGIAAGGGIGMALCGDFIIAAESARFTMAYTNAGLTPDCSTSYFLPRLVGLRKAQELLLNNPVLDAQQALDIGLISKVVSDEQLMNEAFTLAQQYASGPKHSYRQVKALLADSFNNNLEQQLHQEALAIAKAAARDEGQEGIRAFLEKRSPDFSATR